MALISIALNIYGKVESFFENIKMGQAPEKFSQQYLRDMGFTSTNYRTFVPLLKELGFLTSDGVPTDRYHNYRNDAISRQVLGEAVKEAYSDLFTLRENPSKEDEDLIKGKFKSTFNASDSNSNKMMKTFFALLEISDITSAIDKVPKTIKQEEVKEKAEPIKTIEKATLKEVVKVLPSLNYNIQIHLPATKDVEVYNAIFKSIKEHLID
jgi:hypothetical protein